MFDLGLSAGTAARTHWDVASVMDSLTLDVTAEATAVAVSRGVKLEHRDSIMVAVTVPEGMNTFRGRVLSSNAVVLFEGTETRDIREDGFEVDLTLRAVAPVLAIVPESTSVRPGELNTSFTVMNRGIGLLTWRQDSVSPLNTSCEPAPCLFVRPTSGQLEPGEMQRISIQANRIPPQEFTVGFSSPEGRLRVRVVVTR